ncbi:hypothetical protein JCM10207_005499 [Rhodosporidiobolus poonsookiae]
MPRRRPSPPRSHLSWSHISLACVLAAGAARALDSEERGQAQPRAVEAAGEDTASSVGTRDSLVARAGALVLPRDAQVDHGTLQQRATPPSISISGSLPSTSSLSSSLTSTFESILDSLTTLAASAASTVDVSFEGITGTGITTESEARALQAYLDCTSSDGEWVYDPRGAHLARHGSGLTVHKQEGRHAACDKRFYKGRNAGEGAGADAEWDVRESLKWRWVASASCAKLAPPGLEASARDPAPLSRARFCRLLAHKSTVLLGDTTQFSLHDLMLDFTSTVPQTCYGDLYCKEHSLCGDILRSKDGKGVEDWEGDERVYQSLPLPPSLRSLEERRDVDDEPANEPHDHDHPHDHADSPSVLAKRQSSASKSPSYGTMLRYRRTDGLRPSGPPTDPTYKNPFTGVREVNQKWRSDIQRGDIVIFTKAPLPLPRRGHNATWDERVYALLDDDTARAEDKAARLLGAAAEVTRELWLPELVDAVRTMRQQPNAKDRLLVYRSGWRTHPDCGASSLPTTDFDADAPSSPGDGPPPHPSQPSLASLLFRPSSSAEDRALLPPHTVFHNLQLVLQNAVARGTVLPALGVPFLDLETPLSVWRSGMVGSSAALPFSPSSSLEDATAGSQLVFGAGAAQGLRSPTSGDCTRYCFPSPGGAVEDFFLGALMRVFEAGWTGSDEREKAWVGDGGGKGLREKFEESERRKAEEAKAAAAAA